MIIRKLTNDGQTQASYNYREAIKRMLEIEQVRLIVNLDDLRDYDRVYADGWVLDSSSRYRTLIPYVRLLLQPTSFLPAFDAALLQLVQALHDPIKHKIVGNECM